jgi:hypothetical protein
MIKRLLSLFAGAALVLELERRWEARRARFAQNGIAGSVLDRVNSRLEARRSGARR